MNNLFRSHLINARLKKVVLVGVIIAGVYLYERYDANHGAVSDGQTAASLNHAIANQLSDYQVQGNGTVVKILADDNKGSRHQRFLVKLANDHVILIAHNIDLAPRINSLREGDNIEFYGEFEWNHKGGVVHWTHHDPAGRHADGWLQHQGKIYK